MAIALIIPESADMFLDDPHLVTLMAGASHRLEESEYILSLIVSAEDPNGKLMRYLVERCRRRWTRRLASQSQ